MIDGFILAPSLGQFDNQDIKGTGSDRPYDCRTHRVPGECLVGASSLAPCDGATSEKGQPINPRRLRPNVRDGSIASL
jgi:hypothetical protein